LKVKDILDISNSIIENTSIIDENIGTLSTLLDASSNDISFFNNPKYKNDLLNTKARFVLIESKNKQYLPKDTIAIINDDPYLAMAKLSKYFYKEKKDIKKAKSNIDNSAIISDRAYIGDHVSIGKNTNIMPGVYIGDNVSIGSDCTIYPNVVIYDLSIIKSDTIIHSNCTIGSDGFGYTIDEDNNPIKIYHLGYVKIGRYVEIGANTTIDRGVLGYTKISDYCKLDNFVHIAHNCIIGEKTAIVSSSIFAGSTKVGARCIFYGHCSIAGHLNICDDVVISARSVITKDIKKSGRYAGFPAIEHKRWLKQKSIISKMSRL
jgi:UDP-3-O-[3-hydroxymyristoyl] glucosamine N-acyltransferase